MMKFTEVEKKKKSKNDWDIAKEMSSVTALDSALKYVMLPQYYQVIRV